MDDIVGHLIIFVGCLFFGIACLTASGAPGVVRGIGVFCLLIVGGQIIYFISELING